ncbi:MAG TPA: hypothetical protein VK425_01090, partial [Acidimicrobiales bacterium]|nr:hypothetical protein [Acidimicrobiales bacterium]
PEPDASAPPPPTPTAAAEPPAGPEANAAAARRSFLQLAQYHYRQGGLVEVARRAADKARRVALGPNRSPGGG